MLISFEGHDGSGKSTQAARLAARLRGAGREVVETREPGGTPLGEELRRLVLHGGGMSPWAEAGLFAASRAEHVAAVIRPALARGAWVVCDRYVDSSLAYQGIARGLGVQAVLDVNLALTEGLLPELTFLLLLDPEEAAARRGLELDRIEREDVAFQTKVDEAFRELARLFPDRIVALDGSGSIEEIADAIDARIGALA